MLGNVLVLALKVSQTDHLLRAGTPRPQTGHILETEEAEFIRLNDWWDLEVKERKSRVKTDSQASA